MIKWSKVLIMGLTYTKNVADTQESPVSGIVERLSESVARVAG